MNEAIDIVVRDPQLRVAEAEASAALARVMGEPAMQARARLRFGPKLTCERVARMLDEALTRAQESGLSPEALVVSAGSAVAAEDIVRVRRKAHGVADWIASATSDVTIVLRPKGLAAVSSTTKSPAPAPIAAAAWQPAPETEAEVALRETLRGVIDPDLGVNIVDLGFVRQVEIGEDGVATITMTLTSPACPLRSVMEKQISAVMSARSTEYALVWRTQPSWRPHDISEAGLEQLRAIGFDL